MISKQIDSVTEFVCYNCNGKKRIKLKECPVCNGYGRLDWIENIVGKKEENSFSKDLLNELADKMAMEIDHEILNGILAKQRQREIVEAEAEKNLGILNPFKKLKDFKIKSSFTITKEDI